jgi:hypothetical protein
MDQPGQPTPTPVPISRTRPPRGTAAASAASSLPISISQESWKPALAARWYAARTLPGSSSLSVTRNILPGTGADSMFFVAGKLHRRSVVAEMGVLQLTIGAG